MGKSDTDSIVCDRVIYRLPLCDTDFGRTYRPRFIELFEWKNSRELG